MSKDKSKVKVKCKGKASGQEKSKKMPNVMMQVGGEAKWKWAFLKGPLSSCFGLTFSLYLFFQVYTMWPKYSWWADVSMWGVMTLGGATHLKRIGPPSYNLNSYKSLLTGGPHFLQRWFGLFCARLWEELISHFMPILIFIVSYEPSPS